MLSDKTDTKLPVAGIILAAGLSRRMGKSKLCLPFRGRPLVEHVIRAAAASTLSPVIAVLGENAERLSAAVDLRTAAVVINEESISGRASSLTKGLERVPNGHPGIMVLLGDQPLVTSQIIDALVEAFRRRPDRWTAPAHQGNRGNPVIIPRRWFNALRGLTGDNGPKKLLSSAGPRLQEVRLNDPAVLMDVDTFEDYQRLKSLE